MIISNYALASQRKEMKGFTYVYILLSDNDKPHRYTGLTDDLEARLKSHSQGNNPHTSRYRPRRIETAIAFRSRKKAAAFEKYLNTLKVIPDVPLPPSISKIQHRKKITWLKWILNRSPPEAGKATLQGGLCASGAFKSSRSTNKINHLRGARSL
jgi:predicted GIY-YIG superfamily endonuclease